MTAPRASARSPMGPTAANLPISNWGLTGDGSVFRLCQRLRRGRSRQGPRSSAAPFAQSLADARRSRACACCSSTIRPSRSAPGRRSARMRAGSMSRACCRRRRGARARGAPADEESGALDGLSIGFRTVRARTDAKTGVRRILEADLWEISVVTFPMLPSARVSNVKNARWFRDRETELVRHMRRAARQCDDRNLQDKDDRMSEQTATAPRRGAGNQGRAGNGDGGLRRVHGGLRGLQGRQRPAARRDREQADRRCRDPRQGRPHQPGDGRAEEGARPAGAEEGAAAARPRRLAPSSVERREHKAAFDTYIRRGDEAGLRELEAKAFSIGSARDGGYLVPTETDTEIGRRLSVVSPIRALATVRAGLGLAC